MHFAHPQWLIAGLVTVTLLLALLVRAEHLRSRALDLLVNVRLRSRSATPSRFRRWLRVVVTATAVAMGFVALARPQKGMHWETLDRTGIDLLLVVDTSKSMDADDVKPTRLERSKLAIRDLVERFPSDRIGLVAFAGDAFVQSPMTLDHGALLESVDALDTSVIARGGTNIGRGIDVAATALATEPGRQKIMVLLTDGEDLEGQGLLEAQAAASAGITIDTVGVGTVAGELVPTRDARGNTVGIVQDENGKAVRSHLDEVGLKAIASAAHGSYRPLGHDGRGLDQLYDESLAPLTHAAASSRTRLVYSELFELPLALAVFGIIFDALLGRRWLGMRRTARRSVRGGRAALVAAACLLLLSAPMQAFASVESASKSYATGHYAEAAMAFQQESAKHPKDARLAFNAGDAAYRAGQFAAADAAFKTALVSADPHLQQRVLYNEGDVLYRAGEALKPEAREETIAKWKAAIEAYDGALALDSKDGDATYNRDFVKRKLKALEEKKDDKKDSKQDGNKDDKKDSQQGGNKDGKQGDKQDEKKGSGDKSDPKNGPGSGTQPSSTGPGDAKPDAKPSPGQQPGAKPGTGQPQDVPGAQPSPKAGTPTTPQPGAAASTPPKGTTPSGAGSQPQQGSAGDKPGQLGRLSARDARALLGALRGDERQGVVRGAKGNEPTDDVPGKDW